MKFKMINKPFLAVILLLVCSCFLCLNLNNLVISENTKILLEGQKDQEKDLLLGNIELSYTYSNLTISDFPLIDLNGNKMSISNLLGKEKTLLFNFSIQNCSSCIEFGIEYLKRIMNIIPSDRIVVLVKGGNKRELKALAKAHDINVPLYNIADDALHGILEKENVPFFFISDKRLVMEEVFIPIKEIPEHSEIYFRIISMKYFL